MIDIENKSHTPTAEEISEFIGNPLFDELYEYMSSEYSALCKTEYSGDKILLGWNMKFKKAGRTLCTVYPRKGYFPLLLVVGGREKQRVEALLPSFSEKFRNIYNTTQEGMGQRWLLFELRTHNDVYEDILRVVRIRRY